MRIRSLLVLLALVPAALASACTPAPPAGGPSPRAEEEETEIPAPAVVWTRASSADSIARWARAGCRGGVQARRRCVERRLGTVLEQAGVGKAFEALDLIAAPGGDHGLISEAHGLAHGLGIAAYPGPEKMAEVFAECPFTQISGCHHGVIQGYFLEVRSRGAAVGTPELDGVCAPHREANARFAQCAHGLGHGVMALVGHRLPAALEACDRLSDEYVREACYGGAFMENIVGATHPEHTAEAHAAMGSGAAGHGEHGEGHGAHAAGGDAHAGHEGPAWKALDPREPLYPCTAVAEKYWRQCYLIQTGAILFHNRGSIGRTAETCRGAPASMVAVCWHSLGRDITAIARRDPARTAALCADAGEAAFSDCVAGAALSIVDVRQEPADGIAFCRAVSGQEGKGRCYFVVGGTTRALPAEAARERVCDTAEDAFAAECRRGAGLPPRPTAQTS